MARRPGKQTKSQPDKRDAADDESLIAAASDEISGSFGKIVETYRHAAEATVEKLEQAG